MISINDDAINNALFLGILPVSDIFMLQIAKFPLFTILICAEMSY